MKSFFIKLMSVFLCLTLMGSALLVTRTKVQAASSATLMYYNDKAWPRGDSHPMEKIYSALYVPVTLFAQLNNVTVKKNAGQNLFVIENGEYWLTFNVKTDFAYTQDSEPMYWRSAFYHGDHYVPVRSVCSYLRLGFEEMVSPVTGETAIRITDGSQTKPFEELIRDKYPAFFPAESSTENTAPPITSETTQRPGTDTTPPVTAPTPELGTRTIYITIEDSPGKYTEDILKILRDYNIKATFFLIGSELAENAATVSRIAAHGHAIGLHTMNHSTSRLTNANAILADMEAENLLLSRLIKQKSHIWRAPEGSAKMSALTPEVQLALNQKGYVIWDYNINVPTNTTASRAADTAINGIWNNEVVILRFIESSKTAETLAKVLAFIENNRDVCDVRTISPAHNEYSSVG